MKRSTFLILAVLLCLAGTVIAKKMSIQSKEAALRAKPAPYGKPGATLPYATRVEIIKKQGTWMQVRDEKSGASGWLHQSALTKKKLPPLAGSAAVSEKVSSGELTAAEKGFTKQVENAYRKKNTGMSFEWVDRMEAIRVSPTKAQAFLVEGSVTPKGGAQ